MRSPYLLGFAWLALSCAAPHGQAPSSTDGPRVEIVVSPDVVELIKDMTTGLAGAWRYVATPTNSSPDIRIRLVERPDCRDCYRLSREGDVFVVYGGRPLGLQYGYAHLLELFGYRFFHPSATFEPRRLDVVGAATAIAGYGEKNFAPQMTLRGLHLHTLHPIEAFFALQVPGEENLADAKRSVDWLIKNRGNYVQWVQLNDILRSESNYAAWRAHAGAVVAYAHARGVAVGVNVLQFGTSSLQNAFVLQRKAGTAADVRGEIDASLRKILAVPFDTINLSFGEFLGSDPDAFVQSVSTAVGVIHDYRPELTVTGTIHVGNYPDLRVHYRGENLQYYFLVKHVPSLVPWVHSVMFYNLFDDAGGAYRHDEFIEHREFLFDRLRSGQRVAYFPETAYWVAFDNSVPLYLPVYIQSRLYDIERIRTAATAGGFTPLGEHVIFSSGWEWGYWQHDYAVLRANFELPQSWREVVYTMFAPLPRGADLAQAVVKASELQYEYLIRQRLAPYLAGRDLYIDFGRVVNIVSQPDRLLFSDLRARAPAVRAGFAARVVAPLLTFAQEFSRLHQAVAELPGGSDDWRREVSDGLAIDALRAGFVAYLYQAVLLYLEGKPYAAALAEAQKRLDQARIVVSGRARSYHYQTNPLDDAWRNATIYQFGYLKQARILCLWKREMAQANMVLGLPSEGVPSCID